MKFCQAIILAGCCLAIVLPTAARAQGEDKPDDIGKNLEATLRRLEKDIAAERGLAFKKPVQAKIIPRTSQAGKGAQGYYSPKEKTLFLYDDVKGSYQMGVLIHEMVHALQDQHFDLTKLKASLHSDKLGDDAELALAALIEGDATFTMIEIMKKDNPKVALMLEVPLAEATNLQNAFLYSQGARYVKALKEKGGWARVNNAYTFFRPDNTASIFNLSNVQGLDLGPGKVQGAYELFKMLAEHPATRDKADLAAKSWRGGLTRTVDAGQITLLAFSSKENAVIVQGALRKLKEERFKLTPLLSDEAGTTWMAADETIHGVFLRGQRVVSAVANGPMDLTALIDRLEGPPQLAVFAAADKRNISFGEMTERLLKADLICIGETHDAELHHRVQLQIIKALFAYDERLGVGMEMFQRPYQKEIDRYIRGDSGEEEFLKSTEYKQRWGFDWALYKPIVDFCRHNKVPLAGLNVPKELTSRISKVAFAGLTDEEKKQLGPIDYQHKEHRDYWYERLSTLHGQSKSPPEQKERSYQVMATWDDYMAESAARFQKEHLLRRFVVLAGSGHVDRGFGIPQRAGKKTGGKTATIHIEYEGAGDSTISNPVTDYVVVIK
jgi:uncharacterized iron-regulated protein